MRSLFIATFSFLSFLSAISASAQTASDVNEGSLLTKDVATGAYSLAWWGRSGQAYFIQTSEDLVNWHYIPIIELGDDEVIEWGFSSTGPCLFARLVLTDDLSSDIDADNVDNLAEIANGTDPFFRADFDGDGFWDDEEPPAGADPTDPQSTPTTPHPNPNAGAPEANIRIVYQYLYVEEIWNGGGSDDLFWYDMVGGYGHDGVDAGAPNWASKLSALGYPTGAVELQPWINAYFGEMPMASGWLTASGPSNYVYVQNKRMALKADTPVTEHVTRTYTPYTITTDWFTEAKIYEVGEPVKLEFDPMYAGGIYSTSCDLTMTPPNWKRVDKVLSPNRFTKQYAANGFDDTDSFAVQSVPQKKNDQFQDYERVVYFEVADAVKDQIEFEIKPTAAAVTVNTQVEYGRIRLTISGNTLGMSYIFAKWKPTHKPIAVLKVDVLKKTTRTVSLVSVAAQGGAYPANVPEAQDLEDYLNYVWGPQANVWFTVTSQGETIANYDEPTGTPPQKNGLLDLVDGNERQGLAGVVADPNSNITAIFVKGLNPVMDGASFPDDIMFIPESISAGLKEYVCAHELGHCIGILSPEHNNSSKKNLMHETTQPTSPTEIRWQDWRQIKR